MQVVGIQTENLNLAKLTQMAKRSVELANALGLGSNISSDLQVFVNMVIPTHPNFRYYLKNEPEVFREIIFSMHLSQCWRMYGFSVFEITDSLMASLLLTDPSNVDSDELKLPFGTFAVRLPKGFWHISSDVTNSNGEFLKFPASVFWVHSYISLLPDGEFHSMLAVKLVAENGLTLHEFLKYPSGTLGSWLHFDVGKTQILLNPLEQTEQDRDLQKAARRLFVNLCLYTSEKGNGTKKKLFSVIRHRRKQKKNGVSKAKNLNVWILGKEVRLDKNLVDSAKAWVETQKGQRSAWTIQKRFVVRGHWRNQACGPKLSLRKRTWIEPHWKGPKDGVKLCHLYTMESKNEIK